MMAPGTVKHLLLLSVYIHLTSAANHSLQYFYTAVTSAVNFPEFTVVGLVDEEQIVYYDSNIRNMTSKTEWMENVTDDDPDYWNRETLYARDHEVYFKFNLTTMMKLFNQTAGVHTVQRMYGCELDDDETKRGYEQYGYDGEDFLILDLNTLTWTAANDKANITKQEWKGLDGAGRRKDYLEKDCIDWLQKCVKYGRSSLERKVPPEVSVFQKDSSSPVVCHATGFYPKALNITWKNGEDLEEDVEIRETLPNQDGTFQKRSILTVSPEELNKHNYTCIIQHSSLEKQMVLHVSHRRVRSGGWSVGIIVGVVVVVLLLVVIGCVGFFIWKKKQMMKLMKNQMMKFYFKYVRGRSNSDVGSVGSSSTTSSSDDGSGGRS